MDGIINDFIQAKHAAGRKPGTLRFYRQTITEFSQFAAWPPTTQNIRDYLAYKRSYCVEVTVNSVFCGLRAFLNWCERERLLSDNPIARIDKPRAQRTLPKAATIATMKRLFITIERTPGRQAIRDMALFRLAYDTGARKTELAGLKRDDLDLDTWAIMIRQGKGGKDRQVYFGRKCAQALAAWLAIHPGGRHLFINRVGDPLGRTGIYQALQKYCRLAKIRLTVHQLRHSYATHSLRRGIDLGHIQNQLGHADIATTAIYLAVEDEERRKAHRDKSPGDAV